MQNETWPPEYRTEKGRERRRCLAKLGEDQRFLLPSGNDFCDVAQAAELAAVLLTPCTVAEPLRRMVADLLESHQERQNHTSALHSFGVLQRTAELSYGLLVERRL